LQRKILSGGKLAVLFKVISLAILLSLLGTLGISAIAVGEFVIGAFIFIAMILFGVVYLTKISVPMKFFLPGVLLLISFVVAPIVYTISM
jgi:arabinogalactan oligomer/maltooligosaccharide transport system permease protein